MAIIPMLEPDHVTVYFAQPGALLADANASRIGTILDAVDRAHVARFRFAADQRMATASRLLQRMAIGWAADVDPAALRFEMPPAGRPQVVLPAAAHAICFSASNTRDLVGCAVARHLAVGLDIEATRVGAPAELLDECLDPAERQALEALPDAQRGERFIRLWTLKESYLKALGIGLAVAMRDIGFEPDARNDAPVLRRDRATGGDPGAWDFHCLRPLRSHHASVCVPAGHRVVARWVSCTPQSMQLPLPSAA